MLGFIGVQVGANWEEWRDKLHYFDYVVLAGPDRARGLGVREVAARQGRGRRPEAPSCAPRPTRAARPRRPPRRVAGGDEQGDSPTIPPSRAIALGAVQGPTELLPVSSSAHLTLVPWLARLGLGAARPRAAQELRGRAARRRGAALLVGQRRVIAEELRSFDRRKAEVLALSFLPGAAIGLALERQIERRLGGPLPTALGLIAGAAAMALADRRAAEPGARARRRRRRARARARPGRGAGARRLAQRRHPDRRALARLHPRARQHALAHGGAAGDRRRRPR